MASRPARPTRALLPTGVAALLVAVALLAPAGVQGAQSGGTGSASGIWGYLHLDSDLAKPKRAWEAFDTSDMNVYDIDGDGVPELVSLNDNNNAYVIDPRKGKVLAEIVPTFPGGGHTWGARSINGIAIGDVNGNGRTDLVIATSASHVGVWEYDPARSSPTQFAFNRLWETFVSSKFQQATPSVPPPDSYPPPKEYPGLDGNPAIGSVEANGKQWVFVQNDDIPGIFAFDETGATRWKNTEYDGNAGPVIADLNGDGAREVVFVSDGGAVAVYDAKSGSRKWVWHANANGANPGSISVSPVVMDVEGDGKLEIFVGARQAVQSSDPNWMSEQHAWYFLVGHDGKLKWKRQIAGGAPHVYMHGVPLDVNADGVKDIVAVDWNTIGHKPGNWEKVGGGNLFALNGRTGEPLWVMPLQSTWSNKDIAVADVDGDDQPEILVPTQGPMGGDGIGVYSLDGRQEGWFGITAGWQVARGPVVADLWGDGKLSILLPVYRNGASGCVHQLDVGCREGAIEVWITGSRGEIVDGNNDHFNADRPNAATAAVNPRARASNLTSPQPGEFAEWTGNGTDPNGTGSNGTGNDATPPVEGFLGIPAPGVVLAAVSVAVLALLRRRRA